MTEIKDSSNLLDAHSQAKWALRSVAGGLEVSDADVARLESGVHRRPLQSAAATGTPATELARRSLCRPRPRRGPHGAVVGGGAGVPATPAPSALASGPLTAGDLVGVWRVDADPSPIVWVLDANGKAAIWSTPEDLRGDQSEQGLPTASTATCSRCDGATPARLHGRSRWWRPVVSSPTGFPGGSCGPFSHGWQSSVLTRVVPAAAGEVEPKYIGGTLERVEWLSVLEGTAAVRNGTAARSRRRRALRRQRRRRDGGRQGPGTHRRAGHRGCQSRGRRGLHGEGGGLHEVLCPRPV